jgi:hypothetical protein
MTSASGSQYSSSLSPSSIAHSLRCQASLPSPITIDDLVDRLCLFVDYLMDYFFGLLLEVITEGQVALMGTNYRVWGTGHSPMQEGEDQGPQRRGGLMQASRTLPPPKPAAPHLGVVGIAKGFPSKPQSPSSTRWAILA